MTIVDAAPAIHRPAGRVAHWSPTLRMKFYAVLTLLAAVAVIAASLGINSMDAYHARVQEIARTSERALLGEQLDKLVIATVMESRGIYMAHDRAEAENFIPPLLKDLADLRHTTERWMGLFPAQMRGEANETAKKIEEFIAFRTELVRLAREVGLPQAREYGDNDANRENRKALNRLLSDMVARSSADIPQLNGALAESYRARMQWLIALCATGIIGGAGLGLLIYQRGIAAPLNKIVSAMSAVASGNLDVADVPFEGHDEISALGRALTTFKEAQRAKRLQDGRLEGEREAAEKEKQQALFEMCELLEAELDSAMAEALESSREAVVKGEAAVADVNTITGEAQTAATGAEDASRSVASVAAAVEELTASGREIARQASQSTGIVERAVAGAEEARTSISALSAAAENIGEILKLIQGIAAQTNLLALNATIEAARAGEAGKGFAVVASEVKALAHRTTEATDQIVARIEDIRNSTERSVVVIDKVGREVSQIDQASAGVATAVQEQEAALSEVARSITMASQGTAAVAASATAISAGARRIEEVTRGVSNVVRQTDHRLGDLRANVLVALRSSTSVERRAERRIPVNMASRVKIGGQTVEGRILNISSQGAKFRYSDQQAHFAEAQSIAIEIDGIGELGAQILTASNSTLHLQFKDAASGIRTELDRVIADIEATDAKFIKAAQTASADIARLFESAIDRNEISVHALFDSNYLPIDGTDPKQFSTHFVALCDRLLPAVQEPILELDRRVVFCAAVDRNGYLPTHNRVFSQPQRPGEVAWNTANSRNRRIFNDRAGLSAARSTRAHLLQTYERNMGGGRIDIMKEVDVPITVRGRHWGGLRLAYRA